MIPGHGRHRPADRCAAPAGREAVLPEHRAACLAVGAGGQAARRPARGGGRRARLHGRRGPGSLRLVHARVRGALVRGADGGGGGPRGRRAPSRGRGRVHRGRRGERDAAGARAGHRAPRGDARAHPRSSRRDPHADPDRALDAVRAAVRGTACMSRWLAAAVAVVALAAVVLVLAGGGDDRHPAAEREARATPTPTPTPQASIEPAGISEHLRALWAAAGDERTRVAGSPGDAKTARYIAGRLRAAGFRVREPAFRVPLFLERSPARVSGLRRSQFLTLNFSGSGRAAGRVRAIGLGCVGAAYRELRRGDVALARRGVCTFRDRARLAQRAGAGALLVISDRGAPFSGSLGGPGVKIPVLAVSTRAGRELGRRERVRVRVDAIFAQRTTHNVIGEIGPERAERVFMAGAHLDSVGAGPGMNDDGSGVAAVLEVVGSPGEKAAVYAGQGEAGKAIEAELRKGLPPDAPEERLGGASDHASFAAHDIAVGGIFTGLDRCYHRACDRLRNVDVTLAAQNARATAEALVALVGR